MSVTSVSQRITRYFWPAICVTFLCLYVICNTYNVASSPKRRRLKHQRSNAASQTAPVKGYLANFSLSGYREIWHENIIDPQVDISHFPPVDRKYCPGMREDIEVAPINSMPLIALASFPRSGNTWSRSLIQIATRYYTGSVHWESERYLQRVQEWFKAGQEDFLLRRGVCVKTHNFGQDHVGLFEDGAILLLRNPYYSLTSEFIRVHGVMKNESREEIVQMLKNKDRRWTKVFLPTFERWKFTALSWLQYCKRLMIVFYEDLEANPELQLTRMVSFLGQPVNSTRIKCAVNSYVPLKGRKSHTSQMTFDPYTTEMHEILDSYIAEINETLIRKNATPLPTYEKYYHPTT